MAESLEERICNLILKLLTHAFGFLRTLHAAGAVPAGALESFPDGINNLLIGIELDFHVRHLFLDCGFIIPQDKAFFCDEVTLIKNPVLFKHRTSFSIFYCIVAFLFQTMESICIPQRDRASS